MFLFYDLMMVSKAGYSFARKKMKRSITTLMALFIVTWCMAADPDSQISLDISSLMKRSHAKMILSHQISEHWSISAAAAVSLATFKRKRGDEEQNHRDEFEQEQAPTVSKSHTTLCMSFWPVSTYSGPFISAGGKILFNGKADCTMSMGYCMKIYKGFSLSAAYSTDIIDSYQSDTVKGEGIQICLNFKF